jgi:sialidase-1
MAAPNRLELSAPLKQRCFEVLRGALKLEEFWPGMHAAEALTLSGHADEVQAALSDKLTKETDVLRRVGLARELARSGDRGKTKVLFEILASGAPKGPVHAAESLYKVKEIGDGKLLGEAVAQERNSDLQMMAAGALAQSGNKEALALIRKRLGGDNVDAKMSAAWFLAFLGNDGDRTQLTKNMQEGKNEMERCFPALALARLGDAGGKAQLAKNLSAEDPVVRALSAEFAGHCRATDLASSLERMLDDKVLDVRVRAAQALLMLSR